ncbi:pentatricopeptide repeat-containing protein [Senna tora]|uniref:Pentatricopeptide repeat-containing protein n=1 Tax=Senna tora TaxID=362788 RepID=A0A834WMF4_9FABA|nr:pentatricopeptide repeat-containing protein [Senna tora]
MPMSNEASSLAALALVQKCSTITSLKKARQLHALILTTTVIGLQSPFLYNNIISMYARCGSLRDSQLVFDKMPHRNLVSFNALIAACSRVPNHATSALKLYSQMETRGLKPSSLTFTSLLQASSLLEDGLVGSLLHAQAVRLGFLNEICVQTSLLNMYSNCGDLNTAEMVFQDMADRDDVAWNSLIVGNLKNNKIQQGLSLFSEMARTGIIPTQVTYSMILNACGQLKDYQSARSIHGQVIVRNVSVDLRLQNALLDMYCNAGDTQTAYRIFSGMENPDLVSWNSMIAGYSENQDGNKAMNLFVQLQEMCFPKPDEYTYSAIISGTGAFPSSNYGKPLHAQVTKAGLEGSVFVGSNLVSMYFKNNDSEAAQKAFHLISEKDVVLWTEMITGYSKMSDAKSAIRFFCEMNHQGYEVDNYVLSGTLNACADLAILRQGEMIHSCAVKLGHDIDMPVSGSLVDMYAKNGNLKAAEMVFYQVSNPDLKCWNTMLGGYSRHGMVVEAFKLFEEILEQGMIPNEVTFLSLLFTCSHSRLVEKGKFLWNYMSNIGLTPGPKHYSCMVTLLSRAALLEEAEEMINKSPYIEENQELWRTLLSACVINGNLEVGVRAANEVLRRDAEQGPTLVLLSNLYAAAEKWTEVAEIRRKMKGLMLQKDQGLSWIEAKQDIHVFSSGYQSHLNFDEVQAELHRLKKNMGRTEIDDNEAQELLLHKEAKSLLTDAAPKLAPDPVAAPKEETTTKIDILKIRLYAKQKLKKVPEANGVEKSEPPVLAPNGVVPLNREGVEEGPNKEDDEELKSEAWGVALDDPNKEDTGAEVVGVVNRDGMDEGGAEDGVLKSENPLPDEVDEVAADVNVMLDALFLRQLLVLPFLACQPLKMDHLPPPNGADRLALSYVHVRICLDQRKNLTCISSNTPSIVPGSLKLKQKSKTGTIVVAVGWLPELGVTAVALEAPPTLG